MHDFTIKNSSGLAFSMRIFDVVALFTAGHTAAYLDFNTSLHMVEPIHLMMLYFAVGIAYLLLPEFDLYSSWRGRSRLVMFGQVAIAWVVVLLLGLFITFLIHHAGEVSRTWVLHWYVIGTIFLVFYRMLAHSVLRYLRKKGINTKRVILVAYCQIGKEIHARALRQDWYGYEVTAVYPGAIEIDDLDGTSITKIKKIDEIVDFVNKNHIHEIWITLPMDASAQLHELQYWLRNALVDIRWIPDLVSMQMLSNKIVDFLGMPTVNLNRPLSSGLGGIAKELFDKLFAAVMLILLSPLFVMIAIAIKYSSPGPVFFKQPRLGLNGKKFNIYKFRSMEVHQEHDRVTQAVKNDPRVTSFGQFLRRTSLDELPQFINVLLGDMSVVGPRPHALQHNEIYKDLLALYMLRHRVKPGITGWAQINGHRGETDTVDKMEKRVQSDLYYINHWSFWLDLRIIVWTAFKGWTGKNAY